MVSVSTMIAGAGPASNLLLAALSALLLGLMSPHGLISQTLGQDLLRRVIELNVLLGLFNLIPVPPLDGFTVVTGLLPRGLSSAWERLSLLGPALFIILMVTGVLNSLLYPAFHAVTDVLIDFARGIRG